jgi:hypothetical protein
MKCIYFKYYLTIIFAIILSAVVYEQCTCDELKEKQIVTIRVQDIPEKVQIIGRLGHPLEDLLTIQGKWLVSNDKGESLHFLINHINGKELKEKVELNEMQIEAIFPNCKGRVPNRSESWDWKFDLSGKMSPPKPLDGEEWEMLGIESGFFDWYSAEAAKEIGLATFQSPPFRGCGVCTQFKYIAIRKLTSSSSLKSKFDGK